MGTKTIPFDPADYLSSEADIVDYLKIWMEDGSPQEIARAIGDAFTQKFTDPAPILAFLKEEGAA